MGPAGGHDVRHRLTRRTSGGQFIPAVDGLRFVAIAMVVGLHLDQFVVDRDAGLHGAGLHGAAWVHDLLVRGDTGVLLFFGISGFILGLPFARAAAGTGPPVSIRRYMTRRLTRLEPPYIVAMTALLVAFVVVRHQSLADLLPHHLWSLAYLHNQVYMTWNPVNGVAWSLEVEVQFYLLAPVLALLYRLRADAVRAAAIGALALGAALVQLGPLRGAGWRVDLSLAGHLQYFLAGMLVADVVARRPAWSPVARDGAGGPSDGGASDVRTSDGGRGSAWWADVAGFAGFALLVGAWSPASRALVVPVGIAGCLVAALRGPVVARLLSQPWVYVTGGMCYSIYLLHVGVISLAGASTAHLRLGDGYLPNLALQTLLIGIPMAVVCVAFFVLVERPCMDPTWPSKVAALWRRRIGRPDDPGAAERSREASTPRAS